MQMTENNPITAALEHLRRADYAAAHELLVREFDQNPHREELARIANLISPCGMISHAIDALHQIDGSIEAYLADKPVDQSIGAPVPFAVEALATR
jgi:hypothetical protein